MTPELARDIYHKVRMDEYHRFRENCLPVDQLKVDLAGFKAVIEAIESEHIKKQAESYLNFSNH